MKETLTRSLTGVAFVGLVILSLVLHPISYLVLFSLISALAWMEFTRLFPDRLSQGMKVGGLLFITGCFLWVFFIADGTLSAPWLLVLPAALLVLAMLDGITNPSPRRSLPVLIASVVYLSAGFSSMHCLAFLPGTHTAYSPRWILFTFYFLWMNDTLAYVSGRLAGKHPMWPRVSPSKTWEGALGGCLFTLALAFVLSRFYPLLSPWEWIGFAMVVVLSGTLGDFFESWIKRKAGVKDSGHLLPGHGGVLDRFDSALLAMPFAVIFLYFAL